MFTTSYEYFALSSLAVASDTIAQSSSVSDTLICAHDLAYNWRRIANLLGRPELAFDPAKTRQDIDSLVKKKSELDSRVYLKSLKLVGAWCSGHEYEQELASCCLEDKDKKFLTDVLLRLRTNTEDSVMEITPSKAEESILVIWRNHSLSVLLDRLHHVKVVFRDPYLLKLLASHDPADFAIVEAYESAEGAS
jgi:hypothetical protein